MFKTVAFFIQFLTSVNLPRYHVIRQQVKFAFSITYGYKAFGEYFNTDTAFECLKAKTLSYSIKKHYNKVYHG